MAEPSRARQPTAGMEDYNIEPIITELDRTNNPFLPKIAGAPHPDGESVALTFLRTGYTFISPNIRESSGLSLGTFKLKERAHEFEPQWVKAVPYSDITDYNLDKHGFESFNFTDDEWSQLTPIVASSRRMTPENAGNTTELEIKDKAIDVLTQVLERRLYELYGEEFTIIPSRNLLLRLGGCSKETCYVPQNPLMHLDYIDFINAYERQCNPAHQIDPVTKMPYKTLLECPPFEDLVDVLNIWFPTEPVKDWPLGFIPTNIAVEDYEPYEILSRVIAASLKYRDGLEVAYKDNMLPKEAYLFRSSTQYFTIKDRPDFFIGKRGAVHGSFRITNEMSLRHSIELRFMVFRKSPINHTKGKLTYITSVKHPRLPVAFGNINSGKSKSGLNIRFTPFLQAERLQRQSLRDEVVASPNPMFNSKRPAQINTSVAIGMRPVNYNSRPTTPKLQRSLPTTPPPTPQKKSQPPSPNRPSKSFGSQISAFRRLIHPNYKSNSNNGARGGSATARGGKRGLKSRRRRKGNVLTRKLRLRMS
jgi:hypothetical protein